VVRHRGILLALFAAPPAALTIRELALRAGVPYATTWRVVEDLRRLGALTIDPVGASRQVRVNAGSPLLGDLRRIAAVEFAPHRQAALRFARLASRVPVVRKVILFGSVARGEETVGSDVDVAVVLERRTKGALDELDRLATRVQDETGLAVVPIPVTPRELGRGGSFPRTLAAGEVLYERP
jgi:predicted nucleotidyltransferase